MEEPWPMTCDVSIINSTVTKHDVVNSQEMAQLSSGMDEADCTGEAAEETELIPVVIEVRLKDTSTADPGFIRDAVESAVRERDSIMYMDGPLDLSLPKGGRHALLAQHVHSAALTDCSSDTGSWSGKELMMWQCQVQVHVYHAIQEEPAEDDSGEDGVPSYCEWLLPSVQYEGLWGSLYYDSSIKQRLLRYASSALLFGERQVNPNLVSWNRVVLLHGPPGTGKTSLCKALAHKLAVRFSHRFRMASLVEVNAHSLFSKWFSESGKQVSKLFSKITELLEEPDVLVFVLIDEIESLAAARKASGGSEPSDAVRAVNALLTQLDALKRFPNVMVLTTSNITTAIDVAFVDRADIKAYIGPPTLAARYEMLRTSLQELGRAGVVQDSELGGLLWPFSKVQSLVCGLVAGSSHTAIPLQAGPSHHTPQDTFHLPGGAQLLLSQKPEPEDTSALQLCGRLLLAALDCQGLSGRALRKLPFLAHALQPGLPLPCTPARYVAAIRAAAVREQEERGDMNRG